MNTRNQSVERITLYYREGTSDKVYQAAIEPADTRFVVNFAYGRRGSTLTTGAKTTSPVDLAAARKIYGKLVSEKKAKGYTEGEAGTPYLHSDKQVSGILPQLLNPVTEAEVERLLRDSQHCAQEKFDGKHLLARKQDDRVEGINKKGLVVGLLEILADELLSLPGNFVTDGESVGDHYHVFDLLEHNGGDLRPLPYRERLIRLTNLLLSHSRRSHVYLAETAFTPMQKTALWRRLNESNREGIVFKQLGAVFTPGRPNQGGPQRKFKFVATVSAVVAKINPQRSVEVGLYQGEHMVSCGNVTIPANQEIPVVGQVVEVRYLYAYPDSLTLYQPVYLGEREDTDAAECVVEQLKFKAE